MLTSGHLSSGRTQASGCVPDDVPPQLGQCGGCSCSCGQRVGCSLLSAPRTAANSKKKKTLHCPPPDASMLCPFFLGVEDKSLNTASPAGVLGTCIIIRLKEERHSITVLCVFLSIELLPLLNVQLWFLILMNVQKFLRVVSDIITITIMIITIYYYCHHHHDHYYYCCH